MAKERKPAKTQRVTIKDVAAAARVSPMTVSNVLNGKHQFVSERTRKIVEREIDRLNYRIQQHARSLRVSHRRSVGIVIVDEAASFLSDHFNAHVVAGLSNVLSRHDHTLTVHGISQSQFSKSVLIRNFAVDGFCVILSGPETRRAEIVAELVRLDQPVVLLQEVVAPPTADVCIVRQDDAGGGRLIADHLAARRLQSYLIVTPQQQWPAIEQRVIGFRQALADAGNSPTVDVIQAAGEDFDAVQVALAAYLENHPMPDAIVGTNDRIAISSMALLKARDVAIPAEVRVTGFNGFESRRYASPLLTTVLSPAYDMGAKAAELMLQRFETGAFPVREVVFPVQLAPGETT
jgi:LacI family transcriptional regulator